MDNIISSISRVDFINKINLLIQDLLYSPENGYILLKSKDAIDGFSKVVEKYNYESSKISKESGFAKADEFIKLKEKDLMLAIQKHYDSQVLVWIDEVFDVAIDNLLLDLSLDKTRKDEIYNHVYALIDWAVEVKNLSINERNKIIEEVKKEFETVLNAKSCDLIALNNPKKSDCKEFIEVWNSIKNVDDFLNLNLDDFNSKLSKEDISYFQNLKNQLSGFQKIAILDEIDLVNTSIEIAKIQTDDKKYDFISQINRDFAFHLKQNKNLNEEEKIKLIKRRIKLFCDENENCKMYYKQLITS